MYKIIFFKVQEFYILIIVVKLLLLNCVQILWASKNSRVSISIKLHRIRSSKKISNFIAVRSPT